MKINIFLVIGVLLLLILSSAGCTNETFLPEQNSPLPVIDVFLTNGYAYHPVRILENPALREELEKRLGINIRLNYRDYHQDISLLSDESVSGIILSDDPTGIQVLADHSMISSLDSEAIKQKESSFGRYLGVQYGYVFTESSRINRPVLLVSADKLKSENIIRMPYTPEGWKQILEKLKEICSEPLAVYGSPVDPSYTPLLSMFNLTPQGGREFRIGAEKTEYDKLSESGRDYLEFLNELYVEKLLPKDMLSMNIYSAGNKMLKNVSVMTVMYDDAYIRSFLESAEKNGIRIAYAELPVSGELIETDVNKRFFALITANCNDKDLAMRFISELDKFTCETEFPEDLLELEKYELFRADMPSKSHADDMMRFPEINILYQSLKNTLDNEFIIPYYSQIAVGEKSIYSFNTMTSLWRESSVTMMNNTFDGNFILDFYRQ